MTDQYLSQTPLLDFEATRIQRLIADRGWLSLSQTDRIGAAYDFVRSEILFGYNSDDALPASSVLADGYGQCNTKGTLLMALLRALGVPCRFHGFTTRAPAEAAMPVLASRLRPLLQRLQAVGLGRVESGEEREAATRGAAHSPVE